MPYGLQLCGIAFFNIELRKIRCNDYKYERFYPYL